MQIKIDNVVVKTLSDFEVKVITDMVYEQVGDMTVSDILVNTADRLYAERIRYLKDAWLPKLIANGLTSIPANDATAVQTVFDSDIYKNAKAERDSKL